LTAAAIDTDRHLVDCVHDKSASGWSKVFVLRKSLDLRAPNSASRCRLAARRSGAGLVDDANSSGVEVNGHGDLASNTYLVRRRHSHANDDSRTRTQHVYTVYITYAAVSRRPMKYIDTCVSASMHTSHPYDRRFMAPRPEINQCGHRRLTSNRGWSSVL